MVDERDPADQRDDLLVERLLQVIDEGGARQISMKASPPVRAVLRLRLAGEAAGCRTVHEVARRLPDEYDDAVEVVEETFVRYPIPLLQVVGSNLVAFLYEVDWSEGTSVKTLRREGRDRIRLLPGVADRLVVLGPLLRPLVELHWTRDVARWSSVDVDHFLPWSRWPNDAIENLVLADRSCNGAKRDHLAAPIHLGQWLQRLGDHRGDLVNLAIDSRWDSDAPRSAALVRSTYTHLPRGTPLWLHGTEFVAADSHLLTVLGA